MKEAQSSIALVDTNVASYIFKKDTRGDLYKRHIEGNLLMIAAQTLAELEALPLLNSWSEARHERLRKYVKGNFVLIEADEKVCLRWAAIQAEAKKSGRPIEAGDAWIAATASAYAIPLITHNPKYFVYVSGLYVITEQKL